MIQATQFTDLPGQGVGRSRTWPADVKVGVILPVYNRPRIALEAIDCVFRQTAPPDRLVIVDDGSTDATAANIAVKLAEFDSSFAAMLVRQPRGGVSAARNHAARLCQDCHILAMIDSDDLWPDDYLEKMVEPLVRDPDAVASFCDQVFVDTRTADQRRRDLSVYATDTTRRMFLYGPPTPSCTVIRGELFRKLGGYDQTLTCSEDYDLHLRLSLEGRWAYVPELSVRIRRATGKDDVTAHHLTEVNDARIATQRVRMLERFACQLGGRERMPWRAWREGLAQQWAEQGRVLRKMDKPAEAKWCFARALRYACWLAGPWSGLAATMFTGRAQQPLWRTSHAEAKL